MHCVRLMWLPLYLILKNISVLICNLAVADLLFVMTSPVLSVTLFSENFIFGKYICKIFTGWMYTSMYNRNRLKNWWHLSPKSKIVTNMDILKWFLNEWKCIYSDCAEYRSILCCCKSAENEKISVKVNCILCHTYNLDSFIFMNSGC